jgi:hypothetical protein
MAAVWRRNIRALPLFLRAEPSTVRQWIADWPTPFVCFCVVSIVLGAGCYGIVIGSWRDELQAIYTGIKLPMVLLLTSVGNGLLNGMLAPLLGLNVTLRQSFLLAKFSDSLSKSS